MGHYSMLARRCTRGLLPRWVEVAVAPEASNKQILISEAQGRKYRRQIASRRRITEPEPGYI